MLPDFMHVELIAIRRGAKMKMKERGAALKVSTAKCQRVGHLKRNTSSPTWIGINIWPLLRNSAGFLVVWLSVAGWRCDN